MTTASIIVPTRGPRLAYLDVALASVMPQAAAHGADVIVVHDDRPDAATRALADRHGAGYLAHGRPLGINVARNTGLAAGAGELLCLLDDDVRAWPGWLGALVEAAGAQPDHEAFGGPIRPRLEGGHLRTCGREPAPITAMDLGPQDGDAERLWGANLALRRSAVERIGGFDPVLNWAGDEEEWEDRLVAAGGRMRWVALAGVDHRRAGADARLGRLTRAAHARGRAARRFDRSRAVEPSVAAESRVLAGCVWHTVRRGCAFGIVMGAHSAGRLREALAPSERAAGEAGPPPTAGDGGGGGGAGPDGPPDVFSGASGTLGRRGSLTGAARDLAEDALTLPRRIALQQAARQATPQRVLAISIARAEHAGAAAAAARELERSHRHEVTIRLAHPVPGDGKWANLRRALETTPVGGHDWLLLFDDDVVLPLGFLDTFLFCCERFDFTLAQPAHRHRSHAAWAVTRRHLGTIARTTSFVEIGPVTAVRRSAFETLLPFPELHMGWGLDAHWAGVARERGWRLGVVDATPVRHTRPVAGDYPRDRALAEAQAFLAERPYVERATAERALSRHRWW